MKTIRLSDLKALLYYDGVKLAVDLSTYTVYAWNDYADEYAAWKGIPYVSCWIVIDCSENIDSFMQYLEGKRALLDLIQAFGMRFAFLRTDLDTLALDSDFTFSCTLPDEDSFLEDEAKTLVPASRCSFGNEELFQLRIVSFGNSHINVSSNFSAERIQPGNAGAWALFLEDLGIQYQRILFDQSSVVTFDAGGFVSSEIAGHKSHIVYLDKEIHCKNEDIEKSVFYMKRVGNVFHISSRKDFKTGKEFITLPIDSMANLLEETGNGICSWMKLHNAHAEAVRAWEKRNEALPLGDLLKITTGLDECYSQTLNYIGEKEAHTGNASNLYYDSQRRAAARLSHSHLDDVEMVELLQVIDSFAPIKQEKKEYTKLHDFIEGIPAKVFSSQYEFYEQGYFLAEYVRDRLGIHEKVSLYSILHKFDINSIEKKFNPKVFALALWDSKNITIVLNTHQSALGMNNNIIRTTIAHEFAHILVDRKQALPLAEVFIDGSMEPVEKRARAFAAEFLLPRSCAIAFTEASPVPDIAALAQKYEVSEIVAAQQIINGCKGLTSFDRSWRKAAEEYRALHQGAFGRSL